MDTSKLTHPDLVKGFQEITTTLQDSLIAVKEIWDELGVSGEAMGERFNKYKGYILDLMQEMQEEEERNKFILVEKIEKLLKQYLELVTELGMNADHAIRQGKRPLYQVQAALREELQQLERIRDSRLALVEELESREEQVLVILAQHTKYRIGLLTEDNIRAFRTHVEGKEREREHLQSIFEETREAILKIFHDLELQPSSIFEKQVVSTAVRSFILSPTNLADLKGLHQNLEQRLADAKDEAAELREKLSSLWQRLQISTDEREEFLSKHRGYSLKTLYAFKKELQRCEELKSANIALFIKQLRDELTSWWDRCKVSNEERNAFTPFYCNEFSEDMLEMLEFEVSKIRSFYECNRDIFCLVEKRNNLWDKMHELEDRANDPNRLFTNRGGQLLKEEKERKLIQKELPKIEEELLKYLEAYEEKHKCAFLYDGYNLAQFIKTQWEQRNDTKECLKQQRKVTRNTQLNVESRLGTRLTPNSTKKGNASRTPAAMSRLQTNARSAPSHIASLKRKADGTPLDTNVSKKIKESSEKRPSRSRPRFSTSKVRRFGKGAARNLDASNEKLKSNKTRRNIMTHLPIDNSAASIASGEPSYTEFQNHLEIMSSKKICRSSVVPQRCLRERNISAVSAHARHPQSPHPASVSTTTKLTLTPGRITSATHFTLAADHAHHAPIVTVTPLKPPRRNGATPVAGTPKTNPLIRRTSTRLNMKSPMSKSPVSVSSSKLTTPRGRLPIII